MKCPNTSSLLVCEATEKSTCSLSLLHTLVEGTEEARKERCLLQMSQWASENAVRRPSSLALAELVMELVLPLWREPLLWLSSSL